MRTELLAVAQKEVHQIKRDKRTLALLIIAPLLQLTLLGFAVNMDVDHVKTVVADADRTAESRAFISGLLAGDTFERAAETPLNAEAAAQAIVDGRAQMALVVPPGFAAKVAAGHPASVQVLADGSDAQRTIVAQNAASAYAMRLSIARLRAHPPPGLARRLGVPEVRARVLYNPTLNSRIYFVPGVAATLLLVVTLVVTAMGLAREKEAGTLEQILVTPLHSLALVFGKVLPYAVIGLFDLAVAVAVGAVLFDVPIRGALPVLFTAGAFYILTTLGLGLLVASVARTQQQAFMAAFFLLLPMVLLSGFMSPVANMPAWIQPLTLLDPVRHFVEVLRGVLLKGAGFAELSGQIGALALMGVGVFTAAVVALSRRLA